MRSGGSVRLGAAEAQTHMWRVAEWPLLNPRKDASLDTARKNLDPEDLGTYLA